MNKGLDVIDRAFRASERNGRIEVVRGVAGSGKTSLAKTLCESNDCILLKDGDARSVFESLLYHFDEAFCQRPITRSVPEEAIIELAGISRPVPLCESGHFALSKSDLVSLVLMTLDNFVRSTSPIVNESHVPVYAILNAARRIFGEGGVPFTSGSLLRSLSRYVASAAHHAWGRLILSRAPLPPEYVVKLWSLSCDDNFFVERDVISDDACALDPVTFRLMERMIAVCGSRVVALVDPALEKLASLRSSLTGFSSFYSLRQQPAGVLGHSFRVGGELALYYAGALLAADVQVGEVSYDISAISSISDPIPHEKANMIVCLSEMDYARTVDLLSRKGVTFRAHNPECVRDFFAALSAPGRIGQPQWLPGQPVLFSSNEQEADRLISGSNAPHVRAVGGFKDALWGFEVMRSFVSKERSVRALEHQQKAGHAPLVVLARDTLSMSAGLVKVVGSALGDWSPVASSRKFASLNKLPLLEFAMAITRSDSLVDLSQAPKQLLNSALPAQAGSNASSFV